MRSKFLLLTAVGLSSLATARYLPSPQKDDDQKHLFKRQMENNVNPFSPKTVPNTQPVTIRITDEEHAQNAGANEEEGDPGTPRFSDDDNQQGNQPNERNPEDNGEEDDIEPPTFSGVGLVRALNSIDLGPLETGPNIIDPYAALEAASEGREEIRPDRMAELEELINANTENKPEGQEDIVSEQIEALEREIDPNVVLNSGEPEYEYASFNFDDEDDDGGKEKEKEKVEDEEEKQLKAALKLIDEMTNPPLQYRPPNRPKYDRFGRRMGEIINEWQFHEDGDRLVEPYWGTIQPGHEVSKEPRYLGEDTDEDSPYNPNNPSRLSVINEPSAQVEGQGPGRSEDDDEANSPTEEQGRLIGEALQDQNTEVDRNQNEAANLGEYLNEGEIASISTTRGDDFDDFGDEIDELIDQKTIDQLKPALERVTTIDPQYIQKISSRTDLDRPRRQQAPVVRDDEEEKVDPQAVRGRPQRVEDEEVGPSYGGTRINPENPRSMSPFRSFGRFLGSIPKQAGREVIRGFKGIANKVTGRGAKIEYIKNDPTAPPPLIPQTAVEDISITIPSNQQAAVQDISGNAEQIIQPSTQSLNQPVTTEIAQDFDFAYNPRTVVDSDVATPAWGVGHDIYDIPVIDFGDVDENDNTLPKSYYRRRLRK
ncbi:hypothetical protein TWF281_000058 [Arthrobotrys megalospora]